MIHSNYNIYAKEKQRKNKISTEQIPVFCIVAQANFEYNGNEVRTHMKI